MKKIMLLIGISGVIHLSAQETGVPTTPASSESVKQKALEAVPKKKRLKKWIVQSVRLPDGPYRQKQGCFYCTMDRHRDSLCCLCPYTSRLEKHPLAPQNIHPFSEVKTACMSLRKADTCSGSLWFCPAPTKKRIIKHRLQCHPCSE